MITGSGSSVNVFLTYSSNHAPSPSGMIRSVITRSIRSRASTSRAVRPLGTAWTRIPKRSSRSAVVSRMWRSSSASRMTGGFADMEGTIAGDRPE